VHIRAEGLPVPERQFRFYPLRRWTVDFAWVPPAALIVEVEGGSWSSGRHTRGKGFEEDCRKYATAVLLGWRVLRVTTAMVKSGEAVRLVRQALESRAA
jgi:very-short-patch-repair endonuclease